MNSVGFIVHSTKIVSPDNWEALQIYANQQRESGKRIALTSGAFDILHDGHLRYLEVARSYGDVLIVAINSDQHIKMKKGLHRPINGQDSRAYLISGFACVNVVMVAGDVRQTLLRHVRPDIRIYSESAKISDDELGRDLAILNEYGGSRIILPEQYGIHSSDIIQKMRGG